MFPWCAPFFSYLCFYMFLVLLGASKCVYRRQIRFLPCSVSVIGPKHGAVEIPYHISSEHSHATEAAQRWFQPWIPVPSSVWRPQFFLVLYPLQVAAMLEKQERAANGEDVDEDEAAPPANASGVAGAAGKPEVRLLPGAGCNTN